MIAKNRRSPVSIDVKRLASYAIAGTTAVVGSAEMAEAGITYNVVGQQVADNAPGGGFAAKNLTFTPTVGGGADWNFTLTHNLGADTPLTGFALVGDFNGLGRAADFAGFAVVQGAVTYNYVSKLAAGAVINTQAFILGAAPNSGTLAVNAGYGNSQFLQPGQGLIGVRFNTNQFGWVRVNMDGNPLNSFTVVDYAYADKGESIFAGQITAVPEPSSLCLLALGSVGILAWRRRRAAALTSSA